MSIVATIEMDASADLRDLHAWLTQDHELRAWVELVESPPPDGALGPVADLVQIAVESPEVVAGVTSVIIAWLRFRRGDVKIKIRNTRSTSQVDVSVTRVKALDGARLGELIEQIKRAISGEPPAELPPDGGAGG
ncbi:hypothetical protein ACFFV7_47060 [Nonomuraea spiralis]|uniref:Uncharacterized protein n=1 Tax=Nonomuraea spiralis TaxID=46182 RepID=A0ABV5IYI9_9ACTN|nr:hypothetical protein [Nonomuraea spiralis]GGS85265.1 hypothetical protein GCM10010176_031240 [Nonomuraea spiralis]